MGGVKIVGSVDEEIDLDDECLDVACVIRVIGSSRRVHKVARGTGRQGAQGRWGKNCFGGTAHEVEDGGGADCRGVFGGSQVNGNGR